MAFNTVTIVANQSPWGPPADMDTSQPFQLELFGKGGAGEAGGVSLGGQGAGGGEYAQWSSIIVADFSATSITFVAGSAGYVLFTDDVGNNYICGNGQDGADGGLGGRIAGGSDIAPTIANNGGDGRSRGTTSGGGGGGNSTGDGPGVNGTAGSVATGGPGGLDGSGASGGGAGGNVGVAGANGVNGGGGGGGATHVGGSGLPVAKAVVTYTVAVNDPTALADPSGPAGDISLPDNATAVELTGAATNYTTITWTTSDNGTFDDAHSLNAFYTFGSADDPASGVTLTLTATPISPSVVTATDTVLVTRTLRVGPITTVERYVGFYADNPSPVRFYEARFSIGPGNVNVLTTIPVFGVIRSVEQKTEGFNSVTVAVSIVDDLGVTVFSNTLNTPIQKRVPANQRDICGPLTITVTPSSNDQDGVMTLRVYLGDGGI